MRWKRRKRDRKEIFKFWFFYIFSMKKKYYWVIGIVILIVVYFIIASDIGLWPFFRTTPLTWVCPDGTEVLGGPSQCPETSICRGTARCYYGIVTRIVDGDSLEVNNVSIRLALVDAPEYNETGWAEAGEFVSNICPIGSTVLVDEDDGQIEGSYGRVTAVVYCRNNNWNINAVLIDKGFATVYEEFCNASEFANEDWVKNYGC